MRGSTRGLAVGCGINPRYGKLDPYRMAACVIDEAIRNCVAVGADPARIALLDNFCWGNTERPETLGSLVLAAQACHDLALAYGTPFISGKDSLNNEYKHEGRSLAIPPTLLISAIGQVPDVRSCVTMDLKEPGNVLCSWALTRLELGGSLWARVHEPAGRARAAGRPRARAGASSRPLHAAIGRGLVRSCHDLSEGGLAVALAEMAFAGGLGAQVSLGDVPREQRCGQRSRRCCSRNRPPDSSSRFAPNARASWPGLCAGLPLGRLGEVTSSDTEAAWAAGRGLTVSGLR